MFWKKKSLAAQFLLLILLLEVMFKSLFCKIWRALCRLAVIPFQNISKNPSLLTKSLTDSSPNVNLHNWYCHTIYCKKKSWQKKGSFFFSVTIERINKPHTQTCLLWCKNSTFHKKGALLPLTCSTNFKYYKRKIATHCWLNCITFCGWYINAKKFQPRQHNCAIL